MILWLFLIGSTANNFGIGLGAYPNGLLSLKFRSNPEAVLQLTVGTSAWHTYGETWGSALTIGGRALFGMGEGGSGVHYTHFLGAGAGIHSWTHKGTSSIGIVGEGFYTFELFPNPQELPLSVEMGIGLGISSGGMWLFIPLGIHFYIN